MADHAASRWDRLGEFVAGLIADKGVPGLALGILQEGEVAAAGFGVTSVENPLPVTPDTLFQIGSITKTFTATAILRLADQGKLLLDAPVRKYLPEFRVADEAASAQATIRHLLTHTGGWEGDLFVDTGVGDDALAGYVAEMASLEQLAPLGTVFSYNNAGFALGGRIVEVVTGKPFEAALKELVLEPLGLQQSHLFPADVMTHRFAVGHTVGDQGATVCRPWPIPRASWAAGGIASTVPDLLRYARFHLGDGATEGGARLLSAGSLAAMHAPQVTLWGRECWGLGWAVDTSAGLRQVSHGGGTLGQIAHLSLFPERGLALAILTNADRGRRVTGEVNRWVLKEYLGVEVPEPAPIEAPRDKLVSYTGRYARPGVEWELGLLCGRLVAQAVATVGFPTRDTPPPPPPPPASLALCAEDRLLVLDGPMKGDRLDVIRRPDGTIAWLRSGLRINRRQA